MPQSKNDVMIAAIMDEYPELMTYISAFCWQSPSELLDEIDTVKDLCRPQGTSPVDYARRKK